MGKIYQDIDQQEVNPIDEKLETMFSVGHLIEGNDNVLYRDKEITRIYNIMDKDSARTVLLVGDYGSGKRTIIEGYAHKLAKDVRRSQLFEIDFNTIIKKTSNSSDFSKILDDIFYVVCNNTDVDIILVLNNLGYILNTNCYGNAGYTFINNLLDLIETDNIKILATATCDEYKSIEDSFKKIIDLFTVIKLVELTKDETVEIINNDLNYFTETYGIEFPQNVSKLICDNADKYIKEKAFPGKAEVLFDEVCSSISNKYRPTDKRIVKLNESSTKLKSELESAMEKGDYFKCDELNKKLNDNLAKFKKLGDTLFNMITATEDDILCAIGEIVGVPMSKLSENQAEFLRMMPVEIKKNVIGQDSTVDIIVKNIRRNKLGLRKTSHTVGNFMFIGSTGVGKTYLAKQLAKYLYGSEDNMLRLDMSEFQNEIDVSKLLGSAPGYVGYKESGLLVKGLAKKPETVVLFDEIEKAHNKIYDVLLQLLDEGFITGSDGKKVDATKSLIIFTSNIGVKEAQKLSSPLGFSSNPEEKKNEKKEEIIRKSLKNRFSPEFLNRLDNICYFNPLGSSTLKSILKKELDETNINIKSLTGKTVKLDSSAEDWLLKKVEKEDNGARPIIRFIQQNIEETISDMVIEGNPILSSKKKVLVAKNIDDQIVLK